VTRACLRALLACATFLAALQAPPAHAQAPVTLSGQWSASALTVKWVIGDWGTACGPKPGGGDAPATTVSVQDSGGELLLSGGGRTYSTLGCWDQYPGIQRASHSGSARAWKTICKTGPADPRQAILTTSLTATDDTMSFYEAGQYQFVIQGQNCTASVGRYRTFKLLQRVEPAKPPEPAPVPAPSASTAPAENGRCKTLGPPVRLDARPPRKLLRAGEEFSFRAVLYDSAGCYLPQRPTWVATAGGERVDLSADGTVHVHDDAPEGEVTLTASVGNRSAVVTVEVASTERYDALLRSGEWSPSGEASSAPAAATRSVGAATAVAQKETGGSKKLFVAIVCAVAFLLAIGAALLLRRARRIAVMRAEAEEKRREEERDAYEQAVADQARVDAEARAAEARAAAASRAPQGPPMAKTICPVCGTQYTTNAKFCGKDGAVLIPLNR
jgi:hypothetical protein